MGDLTPPHWSHDDPNEQHSLIAILRHGQGQDWDCPIEARLKAADAIEALTAERDRMKAELERVRAETLEEAAKVAEDYDGPGKDYGSGYELGDASYTAGDIARIIRALATQERTHD